MDMDDYGQIFNEAVAAQIRAERAASGMTIAQLVTATGISKSKILRLTHAKIDVNVHDTALISRAFGIEPGLLIQRAQARMTGEQPPTAETSQQD